MGFCTITCSRPGERPEFLEFCKYQLSRMTVKPDKSYFIDYPVQNTPDLIERLKLGLSLAAIDGLKHVYIIEEDDYFPANYFETMAFQGNDFVGDNTSMYYHIKHNGYLELSHPQRASLFTTAFNLDAIADFKLNHWPEHNNFIDLPLWNHAQRKGLKRKFARSGAVGIKHISGGGKGHVMKYQNFDKDWSLLASLVDSESLQFYKDMNKKLNR